MAAGWLGCGRGGEGSCLLPPFGALSLVWPLSFTQFQGCEGIWHHMVLWGRNGKLNKPPNKLGCVLSEVPTSALSCGRASPVSCTLAACPGFVLTPQQARWHGLCQPRDVKQSCRRSVADA